MTTTTASPQEHEQEEAVQSCLDILQSTNPADSEKNFQGLQSFLPSSEEKQVFKQQVHTLPFKVQQDPNAKNRPFILSNYNCVRVSSTKQTLTPLPNENDDDESTISYHRSPWSNNYYPTSSSSTKVQQRQGDSGDTLKRQVELHANEVWDAYKNMYYGKSDNATGSVYIWDSNLKSKEETAAPPPQFRVSDWSGAFLIHKSLGNAEWNSHHVVHVSTTNSTSTYHVQSTVTLYLTTEQEQQPQKEGTTTSQTKISGSTKKNTTQRKSIQPLSSSPTYLISKHLETLGSIIEDVEIDLRSNMDILGIQKTKQVVEQLRPPLDAAEYYAYRPKSSQSSNSTVGKGRRGPPPGGVPMFPGMGGGRGTSAQQNEHSLALQQAVLAQAMKKKSSIS